MKMCASLLGFFLTSAFATVIPAFSGQAPSKSGKILCPVQFESLAGSQVDKVPFENPMGARIHFLGEGANALVYRVVPPQRTSYVIKSYRRRSLHKARIDLEQLRLIAESLAQVDSPLFRVVRGEEVKEGVVKLNDVRGLALQSILSDTSIQPDLKRFLEGRYNRGLSQLLLALQGNPKLRLVNASDKGRVFRCWTSEKGRDSGITNMLNELFVHEKNVVVDPEDLTMTIIDPN